MENDDLTNSPVLRNLQSDLNPKFIEIKSPSGTERKSRYGRVQKELICVQTPKSNRVHTLTGFIRLSPNNKARSETDKPKILSETLAESLVKRNRQFLENSSSLMEGEGEDIPDSPLVGDSGILDDQNNNMGQISSIQKIDSPSVVFSTDDDRVDASGESNESANENESYFYNLNLDGSEVVPAIENSPPKIPEQKVDNMDDELISKNPDDENLDDSVESPDFEIHDPSILTTTENTTNDDQMDTSTFNEKADIAEAISGGENNICVFDESHNEETSTKPEEADKLSTELIKSPTSKDSANGSSIDSEISSVQSGELFWAQIGSYPYWPCIISPDPERKTVSYKENIATKSHIIYHVRFFADNGRRSWVKEDKLLPYNGREAFVQKFSTPQKVGRRLSMDKLYKKTLKNKTWDLAISEAESVKAFPLEERLQKFDEILERSRQENTNTKMLRRLSKSSMYDSQDSLLSSTLPTNKRARSISIDSMNNSSSQTPPIKKIKIANQKDSKEADFKVFSETLKNFLCNSKDDVDTNERWSKAVDINSLWELFIDNHDGMTDISQKKFAVKISSTREKILNLEDTQSTDKRQRKKEFRGIDEVVDDIFNLGTDYLFEDLTNDVYCKFCKTTDFEKDTILKCMKNCGNCFHSSCLAEETKKRKKSITKDDSISIDSPKIMNLSVCDDCQLNENHLLNCFVCKESAKEVNGLPDEKAKCMSSNCGKYYHKSCLKMWPQSTWHTSSSKINFVCPSHTCHTCVSDNPKGKSLQNSKTRFLKCALCPASYHKSSSCIPAGTQLINNYFIICPRHDQNNSKKHVNVDWCFFCAEGGKLICCETCPASVHVSCLNESIPLGKYNCDDCESGRLPLYGELVWVRFGTHRWWPSLILPPTETPLNIRRMKHFPSEFVVRFFGTNDHAWISRSRVYLCQDDDWDIRGANNKKDIQFLNGVQEAKRIMEVIKSKKSILESQGLQKTDDVHAPFPYVKLKINKLVNPVKISDLYDEDKVINCNCQKDIEHPCGSNTGCLNRSLFIECDPKTCPAGERCENQLFEKRIYPKMKIKYTKGKGFGLIALEEISSGTFVTEYVGEIIDTKEYQRRLKQQEHDKNDDYYFLTLQNNYFIDAGPKGNIGRFMNHSCEPNCETQKWTVRGITRIGLFAIQDIKPNEELTFNYMFESASVNKKICFCQSSKCSGFIGEKYVEKPLSLKNHTKHGVTGKQKK